MHLPPPLPLLSLPLLPPPPLPHARTHRAGQRHSTRRIP